MLLPNSAKHVSGVTLCGVEASHDGRTMQIDANQVVLQNGLGLIHESAQVDIDANVHDNLLVK